jgi:hypothetical protein
VHERWARLRFSIIGALLAAPPAKGALRPALQQLAAREWRHPSTGAPVRFSVSTLERWFYRSRNEQHDPVSVLRRKRRGDAGEQTSMTPSLRQALLAGVPVSITTIWKPWPRPARSCGRCRPTQRFGDSWPHTA